VADQNRLALSFFVTLAEDGEILDWSIVPTIIHLDRRLTYREVDRLTLEEENFALLHRLCLNLRERRLAEGGFHLQLPELSVLIDDQEEVSVSLEDNETPAHQIVSEAMVLANSLGARLLRDQKVPAIYRSQAPPREELVKGEQKSLFQLWQNRRRLSRVILDLSPQPHWGLGVPAYTTLSSPIRRYLDLIMQRQLHAALSGNPPPYGREDLESILMALEPALRRANLLKSRRQRYWLLKYLSKRLGQKLPALVLDRFPNRYRLLLTDLLLDTEIPAPPSLSLKPGEMVTVRVDRVHPQEDLLKVSL
jgi:exoribonuclease-2